MCLIVDANLGAVVFSQEPGDDFQPIINWLIGAKSNGRLVIGGRLSAELNLIGGALRFIRSLNQAGRVRLFPVDVVNGEEEKVKAIGCRSDDPHVLALARISGARLLCSRDQALHEDFKNRDLISNPRGKIYQSKDHVKLLGHVSSCGG